MQKNGLHKLGKTELLTIIYEQEKQINHLEENIKELNKQLEDRTIQIQEAGSIADASLKINKIFEVAQQAADEYLRSIKEVNKVSQENAEFQKDITKDKISEETIEQEKNQNTTEILEDYTEEIHGKNMQNADSMICSEDDCEKIDSKVALVLVNKELARIKLFRKIVIFLNLFKAELKILARRIKISLVSKKENVQKVFKQKYLEFLESKEKKKRESEERKIQKTKEIEKRKAQKAKENAEKKSQKQAKIEEAKAQRTQQRNEKKQEKEQNKTLALKKYNKIIAEIKQKVVNIKSKIVAKKVAISEKISSKKESFDRVFKEKNAKIFEKIGTTKNAVKQKLKTIQDFCALKVKNAKEKIEKTKIDLKTRFDKLFNSLKENIKKVLEKVKEKIKGLKGKNQKNNNKKEKQTKSKETENKKNIKESFKNLLPKKKKFDVKSIKISLEELEKELKRRKENVNKAKFVQTLTFSGVVIIAFTIIAATRIFNVLQVSGNSMEPSLYSGDLLISSKILGYTKGDMIAFYHNNSVLIKRIIATEGDIVYIDDTGNVFVNSKKVEENYIEKLSYGKCDITFPYKVPDKEVFVLGDNRESSIDSRSKALGTISEEKILGKITMNIKKIMFY